MHLLSVGVKRKLSADVQNAFNSQRKILQPFHFQEISKKTQRKKLKKKKKILRNRTKQLAEANGFLFEWPQTFIHRLKSYIISSGTI